MNAPDIQPIQPANNTKLWASPKEFSSWMLQKKELVEVSSPFKGVEQCKTSLIILDLKPVLSSFVTEALSGLPFTWLTNPARETLFTFLN